MIVNSYSILVVDDDVDIAANVVDILRDVGYEVATAHNATSAIRLCGEQSFDVALIDYKMPDMNGADLFIKLKSMQPDIVAIMITAFAGEDGLERAKQAGTWQLMRKPVDVGRLLAFVEEATHQPLVLVVDDDVDFCLSLSDILQQQGYRVGVAHSVADARRAIAQREFDLAILDLRLGEQTAEDVLPEFERLDTKPRTVLVTGHREQSDPMMTRLIDRGIDFVCYKPLDTANLIATLRTLTSDA